MNKELAESIENFYSVSERVTGLITKSNNRYKMKIIQIYAPTSAYDDEDLEAVLKLHKTRYSFIVSNFNAKVRK